MSGHYSFTFWDGDDVLSFHSWTHRGSKVISIGWHNRWSVWLKLSFTFSNVCIERKCKSIRFSSIFDPGLTFFYQYLFSDFFESAAVRCNLLPATFFEFSPSWHHFTPQSHWIVDMSIFERFSSFILLLANYLLDTIK